MNDRSSPVVAGVIVAVDRLFVTTCFGLWGFKSIEKCIEDSVDAITQINADIRILLN